MPTIYDLLNVNSGANGTQQVATTARDNNSKKAGISNRRQQQAATAANKYIHIFMHTAHVATS